MILNATFIVLLLTAIILLILAICVGWTILYMFWPSGIGRLKRRKKNEEYIGHRLADDSIRARKDYNSSNRHGKKK